MTYPTAETTHYTTNYLKSSNASKHGHVRLRKSRLNLYHCKHRQSVNKSNPVPQTKPPKSVCQSTAKNHGHEQTWASLINICPRCAHFKCTHCVGYGKFQNCPCIFTTIQLQSVTRRHSRIAVQLTQTFRTDRHQTRNPP